MTTSDNFRQQCAAAGFVPCNAPIPEAEWTKYPTARTNGVRLNGVQFYHLMIRLVSKEEKVFFVLDQARNEMIHQKPISVHALCFDGYVVAQSSFMKFTKIEGWDGPTLEYRNNKWQLSGNLEPLGFAPPIDTMFC